MNRVDEFIEAYKKLEEAARRMYHIGRERSVVAVLKRQRGFEELKSEIQSCADLRNYFQHNSRLDERYAAEPTEAAIAFVRALTDRINRRPRCREICVKKKDILWRRMTDPVRSSMQAMRALGHSSIPLLQDGRVVGVFDDRALFHYAADCTGSCFSLDDRLTFQDLAPYVSVSERNMQSFAFAGMNDFADDAAELFERPQENGKRVRLVLLTASGKATDRLQGILTPWDILAHT